jgi:hypothetical protein
MDIIGPLFAVILTLMVFSYIFGDNVLFRLATHIFVGVAVGYAIIAVLYGVWHKFFIPAVQAGDTQNIVIVLPAVLLSAFLILKIRPQQSKIASALGNIPLALVLGVGTALAIGGALFGTLLPQTTATMNISLNLNHYPDTDNQVGLVLWLNNIIIMLGTIGTFFYFTFAVRAHGLLGGFREGFVRFWAGMGRLMIIFTLAALFANTFSSRVALLISRLVFLTSSVTGFFGG